MSPPRPSPKSSPRLSAATTGQLRIIGGTWRGRKLSFPDVDGLRPTGDRIRETLFNWLAPEIQNSRCLDLFAGSGALGLEALSRGAALGVLIERNPKATAQLRVNLQTLKADNCSIIHDDALSVLQRGNSQAPYHIVFIDPPFSLNLWQAVIDALESGAWLADDATIYIEAGRESVYQPPINWQLHREKFAGQVCYRLFYREK